ncbi:MULTISPECIES: DNA cytosine methyltransferase [unclassified Brucella]|uniref:DNA cytosine methyltransferase n=1 Tax=unclassified Brucella TaxID=2632610 RepID=UPI0012AE1D62|nr:MULTISPECIES: DNA cytosine methyltransferase [unclassified Brucella]MRN43443.1 DNA (cytosine-5-)-methyltransferase [Brucella sp. 09RB8913]MRN59417.1 DNA (cytosine-5-)-methyltransferase [Brucella sp. 09RB8918]
MIYGSVCSGIEAASVAWGPLGWRPAFFSEIERFPCQVLAHHYGSNMPGKPLPANGVPNLGDMTKFKEWPDYAIDLLVGGTPCQSFSIAGLRKGLADPRGNLMLTYLAIARRYQPRWLVWENVPGVLSSNKGRDFGTFIQGLEECGYHATWRVLDSQYVRVDGFERAVPQRRRRVFVVGYLGDWRRAAAVLFERESMSGNPAPRREAGENIAPTISARPTGGGGLGTDFDLDGGVICMATGQGGAEIGFECSPTLDCNHEAPIAFDCKASGQNGFGVGEISPTLRAMGHTNGNSNAGGQVAVQQGWAVRRLTPTECERLQGFPDNFTNIPVGKKMAADSPRYKSLGNSMSINTMRWIGQRIQMVDAL